MKRQKYSVISATIVFLILFSACGGQKSPSETFRTFVSLANEGKYSEAEKYFSSDFLEMLKGPLAIARGGKQGAMDTITKNMTVKKIEILDENVRGEGATVHFKLHYNDGTYIEDNVPMKKEDRLWKLTISK